MYIHCMKMGDMTHTGDKETIWPTKNNDKQKSVNQQSKDKANTEINLRVRSHPSLQVLVQSIHCPMKNQTGSIAEKYF